MSAAKTKAQKIIDENAVGMDARPFRFSEKYSHCDILAVFSKSYCPYCRATKQTLSDMGANFYAIELDQVGTFPFNSVSLI